MRKFKILCDGRSLGFYEGETEEEAIEAMVLDGNLDGAPDDVRAVVQTWIDIINKHWYGDFLGNILPLREKVVEAYRLSWENRELGSMYFGVEVDNEGRGVVTGPFSQGNSSPSVFAGTSLEICRFSTAYENETLEDLMEGWDPDVFLDLKVKELEKQECYTEYGERTTPYPKY